MNSSGKSRFAGECNFPEKDIALRDLVQVRDVVPQHNEVFTANVRFEFLLSVISNLQQAVS